MSKIAIIYGTQAGSTEIMARAVEEGAQNAGADTLLKNVLVAKADDLKDVDGLILGAPTYHADLFDGMKNFLIKIRDVNLKGKVGSAFGSYGWSGEAVGKMIDTLKYFGMKVIEPGLLIKNQPDENGLEECRRFGEKIAKKIGK
ncbi:MAG: FprA family A-type flavoprotein [Nitrospirae bacterium]|nr:FprA family A-type flavoprotein [Nitrospirota bacterium]